MKKNISLIVIVILMLSMSSFGVFAEQVPSCMLTTPVTMEYVGANDGDYEYKVKAEVTVMIDGMAAERNVSLIMFGNKDNSDYVAGDGILNLTVDSIKADFYVYYIDQGISSAIDGKLKFEFNVVLPSPAQSDEYYIWVGAEGMKEPAQGEKDDLGVSNVPFTISVSADAVSVTQGTNINLTSETADLFGKTVDSETTSVEYFVTKNGQQITGVVIDSVLSTASLEGDYEVYGVLTRQDGTNAKSNTVSISVAKKEVTEYILGDVDGDAKITVFDAVMVLEYAAGTKVLDERQQWAANVDADNTVGIVDATGILKYIARIITKF